MPPARRQGAQGSEGCGQGGLGSSSGAAGGVWWQVPSNEVTPGIGPGLVYFSFLNEARN